jgi:hypothetical protein
VVRAERSLRYLSSSEEGQPEMRSHPIAIVAPEAQDEGPVWWRPDKGKTCSGAKLERAQWGSEIIVEEPSPGLVTVYFFYSSE